MEELGYWVVIPRVCIFVMANTNATITNKLNQKSEITSGFRLA
jgi:hypothetical protein